MWSPSEWAQMPAQGVHVVYPVMWVAVYSCGGAWPRGDALPSAFYT